MTIWAEKPNYTKKEDKEVTGKEVCDKRDLYQFCGVPHYDMLTIATNGEKGRYG